MKFAAARFTLLQPSRALYTLLLLAFCLAAGAAHAAIPPYERQVCGNTVVYHPDDLRPCKTGAGACTIKRADEAAYHIHYSSADMSIVAHEEEHVCGMHHREPWIAIGGKVCSVVTDGGQTSWKAGDLMCRVDSGGIVKVDDPRIRAIALERPSSDEERGTAVTSAAAPPPARPAR